MAWQWLFRAWLANAAKQQLYEAAQQAVREKLRSREQGADESGSPPLPPPCEVGILFATQAELGGSYDLLREPNTFSGQGFTTHLGQLGKRHVALVKSGEGPLASASAAQALIEGHHPGCVIAAGFADALQESLRSRDVIIATHVRDETREMSLDLPAMDQAVAERDRIFFGRLLTSTESHPSSLRRQELGQRYNAIAIDPDSFAVAEVCRREGVPFLAVRVVLHGPRDEPPAEIRNMAKQQTLAGRLGATVGALVHRPGSVKDMWQVQEDALVASDRLAKCLDNIVAHLSAG
jgi:adenosylhomocysteine nucleosidase